MQKSIKYILGGVFILILAAFTVLAFTLNGMVKSGIESTGSELTQTGVTVDQVSINPWSGRGTIEGLRVRNPDGFESEYAMVMGSFDIGLDIASIFSDTLVIREIVITEPDLSVIQKIPQNNLRILMRNMEEAASAETAQSASQAMLIERLLVQDARITVTPNIGGQPSATVTMDELELQNIGQDGSAATRQVIQIAASRLIDKALQTALSGQLDELKNKAKDAVKDIFN